MKKISTLLILCIAAISVHAQWTPLTSGTTNNLYAVDFLNPDTGVVGGDSGLVMVTTDGGLSWNTLATTNQQQVYSVKYANDSTILVSYLGGSNPPIVEMFRLNTSTGNVLVDSTCFKVALGSVGPLLIAGGSILSRSQDGLAWDTSAINTCGTHSIDRIKSSGDAVYAMGNISGFITYSAYGWRSDDAGSTYHTLDVFSFPNANAMTALAFPTPDTGYFFMNQYSGFMPGVNNSLVKTYGFYQSFPTPNDTQWSFTSQIVNSAMPALINDGYFSSTSNGYAAGNDGNIYKTLDSGATWTIDYSGTMPLNQVSFPDKNNGYAVGNRGTIVKLDNATALQSVNQLNAALYPNPATDKIFITLPNTMTATYELFSVNGSVIKAGSVKNNDVISISELSAGNYFIKIKSEDGLSVLRFVK